MKKIIFGLSVLLLLSVLCISAAAEDFALDDKAVINGMDGRSWYQGYQPSAQYGSYNLCFPLRSEKADGNITVSVTLEDPNLYLFSRQPGTVTVSPRNGIYPAALSLPLAQNRRNGDYPALLTVTGHTASGEALTECFSHVIRIRDGGTCTETIEPEVTLEGVLTVGQEGKLLLTIRNPAKTLSMAGGSVTISEQAGDVQMLGADSVTIPEILPGKTVTAEIPVAVKGNAAVELHSLSVKLSYRVMEQPQSWGRNITCPVTQEIRLEQGGVSLPSSVIQGELASLSVPLMNLGKGEICNAMVSLEFPWMARQTVLVGTIKPGDTGQAKLTFQPGKDVMGDYSGTVTITCEDAYGNPWEQRLPVELIVEAAKPVLQLEDTETGLHPPAWLLPTTMILCVLLLTAFIAQGAILRGKLHKLEEERL